MIDQKSPMNQNTAEEFEFLRVGKEMPYKVPEGFFEAMPERTLQKAKARNNNRQRRIFFTSGFVVFAAAAAILAFVFLMPNREIEQETGLASVVTNIDITSTNSVNTVQPIKNKELANTTSVKESAAVPEEENLEDILKNLSDEDLSELLAEYRADDLEEGLSTEITNIN